MKKTITESGGLYWLQHSPPRSLLRSAIGAQRGLSEHLGDVFCAMKSLFRRVPSLAAAQERSHLVIGSAARCISPCLQRTTNRSRRLIVVAR